MSIFDVRHQVAAQRMLQQAVSGDRTAHAYVFHGPSGVGKRMLALRFAKLLLCQQRLHRDQTPKEYAHPDIDWIDACGRCQSCTLIAANTHPDCHRITRQLIKFHPNVLVRNRKGFDLGVDVIRHFVIEASAKKPAMGPAKVFVISEADKLNVNAQNALLKTLEEPPPGTFIILLTRSLDTLLATTQSRCQLIPFMLLPKDYVAKALMELCPQLSEAHLQFFAFHEPGSIGRSLNLIRDGFFEGYRQLHDRLLKLRRRDALDFSKQLEKQAQALGKTLKQRLKGPSARAAAPADTIPDDDDLASYDTDITDTEATRQATTDLLAMLSTSYRAAICASAGATHPIGAGGPLSSLPPIDAQGAQTAIRTLAATEYKLNRNSNTKLCLDELAIRLARLHDD